MSAVYDGIYGQSNYDICLGNTYGTLDLFIKLLSDNKINSNQTISVYTFDLSEKINTNNVNNTYATK